MPDHGAGHRYPATCPSLRFLVYGRYCSQVESASKHLDHVAAAREDVQMKLEVGPGRHLGGSLTPSQAPGAVGRRQSWWCYFLSQPSQGLGWEVLPS